MSKREAVPKHSLPPQKQILSYMGRFINCPYAPDTETQGVFSCFAAAQKKPRRPAGLLLCVLCVRRERKSHKEGKFLWMLLYYPEKLAKS